MMRMMRMMSLMTMVMIAIVFGMSSCGSDDDDEKVEALAAQVAGSYTGNEVIMVMGDESSNDTKTYEFAKTSDVTLDMTVPEVGMGMMTIPSFSVKNIPLAQNGNTITGKVASYAGTVKNADGAEKAYTVSDVTVMFSDRTAVVKFTLKYGNMPMGMETTFTGTKK